MDSDDKAPRQDLMRRLFQRSAWRIALFLLLILLAYIAPRLYLYRGVEMTSAFKFVDMSMHLVNLDLLQKNRGLSVDQLKDPFIAAFPEVAQRKIGIRWPAGAYSIASHGARIWGPLSIWTTQLTTFLFTMILVAGVIFMGRAMGSLRVGLWGGLFTVLCPPLVASTWYFSLDYCMGAMVLVGLYLLYQTRGFTSPAYSLAFALWCSFGMNVKTSYGLYFVVPALLALILGRRSAPDQVPLKRVLLMAVGAFFLSVATFLAIHDEGTKRLLGELWDHFKAKVPESSLEAIFMEPFTFRWATAMVRFTIFSFTPPLLLLALPGLVLIHSRLRRVIPARWLILGFVWGTYLVFTLMSNKMERYFQPVYPLLCLLTAWWIITLIPRRWQTAVLTWTATIYAAIFWLAQEKPTPWVYQDEHAGADAYMYEIEMPGRQRLDGLRRNTLNWKCKLAPLFQEITALVKEDDSLRPLGMTTMGPANQDPLIRQDIAHMLVAQAARGRFVVGMDHQEYNKLTPAMERVPSLLLFHPPGMDVTVRAPSFRRVAEKRVDILCGAAETRPMAVTLLRRK